MISEIITRLQQAVPALKLVGGAAQFQNAAERNPNATPAAFVINLKENAAPTAVSDFVIQRVSVTLGVVLVVRNLSDAKGAAAGIDMEALSKAVKTQLLGWQPCEGYDPLERGSSNLLTFKDGHMWWQDTYLTSYIDRETYE
jgi:hypothetical protein